MEDRLVPAGNFGFAAQRSVSYTAPAAQISVVQPPQVDYGPALDSHVSDNAFVDIPLDSPITDNELQPIDAFPDMQHTYLIERDRVQTALQHMNLKAEEYRGLLGQALPGNAQPVDDGFGFSQHFQGGSIYWSPGTDAHVVYGAIRDKLNALGGVAGFGYPATDEMSIGNDFPYARYNDFLREGETSLSTIVWSPEAGAHSIIGAIREKWVSQGAGEYAIPTSDEYRVGGRSHRGAMQDFKHFLGEELSIVWSEQTGAHDVANNYFGASETQKSLFLGSRARWLQLGGAAGVGFPVTDQFERNSVGWTIHPIVHFAKYSFFTDDAGNPIVDRSAISDVDIVMVNGVQRTTQVHLYGKIYEAWMARGAQDFGMPISGEEDGGDFRYVRFDTVDGVKEIRWSKRYDTLSIVTYLPSGDSIIRGASAFTVEPGFDFAQISRLSSFADQWYRQLSDQALVSPSMFDDANRSLLRQINTEYGFFGPERIISEEPIEVVPPTEVAVDLPALAAQLAFDLQLVIADDIYTNGYGAAEKWLTGGDGSWYFMLPDGSLYLWDWTDAASGTLIATFDPTYYEDLTLLVGSPPDTAALDAAFAEMA